MLSLYFAELIVSQSRGDYCPVLVETEKKTVVLLLSLPR